MATGEKLPFGTIAWFEMIGGEMCAAAARAALPPEFNVSLLERYRNGETVAPGLIQGFRLEIRGGRPTFRVGAGLAEGADVVVDATVEAIDILARLHSADPAYGAAIGRFMADGSMSITGDPGRLGGWMSGVHDAVCDRTV